MSDNQQKLQDLDNQATDEERIEYKVLYNGRVTALKKYQEKPTEQTLRDMRAAGQALDDYRVSLKKKYSPAPAAPAALRVRDLPPTTRLAEVLRHLQAMGYAIKKSTLYNHAKTGRLRKNTEGNYTPAMLRKYLRDTGLIRTGAVHHPSDANATPAGGVSNLGGLALDQLPEEKLRQEVRKLRAQARREQLKADREAGRLVDRDDLYLELAARAVVLNTGFRQLVGIEAPQWLAAVKGDPSRLAELEDIIITAWDGLIGQYATRDRFEVLFDADRS